MIDHGDAPTVPGYHEETLRRIQAFLEPVHAAGVTPLCIGGDHSMVLAELRAAAAAHGRLALVHLDAHADVWDAYYGARYFHGTVFRRAAEEGLVDPAASVQAGMRGTLYGADDEREPGRLGYEAIPWARARGDDAGRVRRSRPRARRRPAGVPLVRHRLRRPGLRAGHRHARGGRPDERPGARLPARAAGIDFRGFDCVEVAPAYDPAGDHLVAGRDGLPRDALAAGAAAPRRRMSPVPCLAPGDRCQTPPRAT